MSLFYFQVWASHFPPKRKDSSSPCTMSLEVNEEVTAPNGQSGRWEGKTNMRSRQKLSLKTLFSHITLCSQWWLLFISRRSSKFCSLNRLPELVCYFKQKKERTVVLKRGIGFVRGNELTWDAFQDAGRKGSRLAELKYMNHSIIHDLKTGKKQSFQLVPEYEPTWKGKFWDVFTGRW